MGKGLPAWGLIAAAWRTAPHAMSGIPRILRACSNAPAPPGALAFVCGEPGVSGRRRDGLNNPVPAASKQVTNFDR